MTFSTEIKIDQKGRGRQTFSKRKWANNRVRIQNSKYMSLKKRLRVVKPYKEFQVRENSKTITLQQNTEECEARKKRSIKKGQYILGEGKELRKET